MAGPQPTTIIGVFKGMGDLLCAFPVVQAELERNRSVHVMLFSGAALAEFSNLIDFYPYQRNMHIHVMPTSLSVSQWVRFLGEMRSIHPELVWISAHAPVKDSSWKIPLLLRAVQLFFWKGARLVGADSERLSFLFHQRLHVDRSLPLQKREWSAYRIFRGPALPQQHKKVSFLPEITDLRKLPPRYDLVIHPGANAINRKWPIEKYGPLLDKLPRHWKVAVVGLPDDINEMKKAIPAGRSVSYVSGSIRDSIETLASATLLLVMDSGNMHFAQVLDVPAVAVFGYNDPSSIIDVDGCVNAIYEQRFPCQPCKQSVCNQPEVYCLNNLEPATVAARLMMYWDRLQNRFVGLAGGNS